MPWPGFQRRRAATWLTALCSALLTLAGLTGTASALTPDPATNYPEQIPSICTTTPLFGRYSE